MLYKGGYDFSKHYYLTVGDFDSGEEEQCARYIDETKEVEYWVRNPVRRPRHAFWLQTSTDKFNPDFVCKLRDDRILVVEYKGKDRWITDSEKEKRDLGTLWEDRSAGSCHC